MGVRDESDRQVYSVGTVKRLLGIGEGWALSAPENRRITVVDLLSWAHDPGGDSFWFQKALKLDKFAWMARRGPLELDGDLGCLLLDFMRAVSRFEDRDQAVIALTAFGFSRRRVARVLHISPAEVNRVLWGDQETGREGAVKRITRQMNGGELEEVG